MSGLYITLIFPARGSKFWLDDFVWAVLSFPIIGLNFAVAFLLRERGMEEQFVQWMVSAILAAKVALMIYCGSVELVDSETIRNTAKKGRCRSCLFA